MKLVLDIVTLEGDDVDEWNAFCHIIGSMEPEYVVGILEHYDLENWL